MAESLDWIIDDLRARLRSISALARDDRGDIRHRACRCCGCANEPWLGESAAGFRRARHQCFFRMQLQPRRSEKAVRQCALSAARRPPWPISCAVPLGRSMADYIATTAAPHYLHRHHRGMSEAVNLHRLDHGGCARDRPCEDRTRDLRPPHKRGLPDDRKCSPDERARRKAFEEWRSRKETKKKNRAFCAHRGAGQTHDRAGYLSPISSLLRLGRSADCTVRQRKGRRVREKGVSIPARDQPESLSARSATSHSKAGVS